MNIKNNLLRIATFLVAVILTFTFVVEPVLGATREAGDNGTLRMYNRNAGYNFGDNVPPPFTGGVSLDNGAKWAELRIMNNGNPNSAYCVQFGIGAHTGDRYTAQDSYDNLSYTQKLLINYTLMFGYDFPHEGDNISKYFATQSLIWQIQNNTIDTGHEQVLNDEFFHKIPEAQNYYNEIKSKVYSYKTVPSFCGSFTPTAPIYEMSYNSGTGKYEIILTDTNNVLDSFDFSATDFSVEQNGNQITISTSSSVGEATITSSKDLPEGSRGCIVDYWVSPIGSQAVCTPNYNSGADPVTAVFKLKVSAGNIDIVKQSEDGQVADVPFRIIGNGVDTTVTTGADGSILADNLPAGEYEIIENAAEKYVQPESQMITVFGGQTTTANFSNILKKFRVEGMKHDSDLDTAQGDATLVGAVYGLYNGNELVEQMTTAADGSFTTQYYICGDDWWLQEISPSPGYLLDTQKHKVGAEAKNYSIERNTIESNVYEEVIQGRISLVKHLDEPDPDGNGNEQIEKPEANAQFQVYLKSSGSYDGAKESERDLLVTNENGYAATKPLPYGTFTVHQVSGTEGHKLVPDFDVSINEHGKTYSFILSNPVYRSLVEIVKKDAETGKVIPLSGTGFKVKDMSTGNFITQHINYPTPVDIDVFYTDTTGKLMLPEKLKYGMYQLFEEKAPNGYILNGQPVNFRVDGTVEQITVTMSNMPVKGTISIFKSGEYLVGSDFRLTEHGKMYSPIYTLGNQQGAVFDIIAAADIITPDGTVRARKGAVVDTLTTTSEAAVISKKLYLGEYVVLEKKAPNGMVLNPEKHNVTLTYAGQHIPLVSASTRFINERQKVTVKLHKALEQDNDFQLGMNEEYKHIFFGLYAGENIKAADGSIAFEKDCLIEVSGIAQDGTLQFKTDLPLGKFYTREIATDEHYIFGNQKYPFEFKYQGQNVAVVDISINSGKPIQNELIRGNVNGLKVDQDGFSLAGATLGLFSERDLDKPIFTTVSNEIGYFEFLNIPYGVFYIKEIESPEGFLLSDKLYKVVISENDQTIEIEVENQLIKGAVQVTKVDEEYPDNKLTGAVFQVIADIDRNGEYDNTIDKVQAGILQEVTTGVYRLSDIPYGSYFLHEVSSPEGFLHDDNYYPFKITEDGKIVEIENQAGVGFVNAPIIGKVEITKTDISTGKPLPNTGIEILDEHGKVVVQGRTDESGLVRFTLRYGKFYYREFDAPPGYLIDENKYPFEIKENGEIVKCQMTNEAKIGSVVFDNSNNKPTENLAYHTPKTGDDSFQMLLICLTGLSLFCSVIILIISYRKQKKQRGGQCK